MASNDDNNTPADAPDTADVTILAPKNADSSSSSSSSSSASTTETIPDAPAPWAMKADVYFFSWWMSGKQAKAGLPTMAYSPLEAASDYAAPSSGTPVGGLSMVQILRYKDSPVGAYDELIVVPGSFDYTRDDAQGRKRKDRNPRISRIYVSQKHTCYNGRKNWGVPKHLARFDWASNTDGSTTVKVFPHDMNPQDTAEANASPVPFFQATFKPWRFAPSFPLRTSWLDYLGITSTLVLPPLPQGTGSQGELPGTDRWYKIVPQQYSRRTMVGWFDIAQHRDDNGRLTGDHENFWPGLGRWQLGMKMENADLALNAAEESWEPPRSNL
ncbi:hypothetical protein B0J13DRAFT_539787 [Dactylonectria estremocensis]|uniref:Uncharacterized protein n=1 Tax=Dactylonectria estremocensis TaxID=1079267 RepID=A0A9P9JC28_9HYPO|nr:hypothetical protein B0J13DRAFT_539787 [Dactylonectria estremocensis]